VSPMSDAKPLKPMPPLNSDEEAERFVAEADLTEYDLSGFEPMRFELRRKDKTVSLRLPSELLDAAKEAAARGGHPVSALHAACDRAGSRRATKSDRPES
jgi:predicted DNA binding CopG/RHH family protein